MTNTKKIVFYALFQALFLTSLIGLSGCGENVCVGGIGKCDAPKPTGTPSNPADNSLKIMATPPTIRVGGTVVLTTTGGTAPYSNHTILQGTGTLLHWTKSANSIQYQAPPAPDWAIVQVTDSLNHTAQARITITP